VASQNKLFSLIFHFYLWGAGWKQTKFEVISYSSQAEPKNARKNPYLLAPWPEAIFSSPGNVCM
jgi:hypothetical protein